jgi:RNA polymerase sigma-70 factor (ECF subfamily)
MLAEADAAARRLHRRLRLRAADLEDLRQDLLVDLIRRLPAFDARRGGLGVFAGLVLRNRASVIALRLGRERRAQGGGVLSLDAPLDPDARLPLGATLAEADGLSAWHGQPVRAAADAALRIDVARALGRLAAGDRALCAGLCLHRPRDLVAAGAGSRSALHRRVAGLRCALAAHGLAPRWDVSESA